jgi:pyruvate dehydrogenase (quinone)
VEDPEHVGPAWDEALAADRPVLIDAVVDPNVPTVPPRVTRKELANYFSTLMKGDPDEAAIIRRTFRQIVPA